MVEKKTECSEEPEKGGRQELDPAADEQGADREPPSTLEGEEEGAQSRMAMSLQEAQIIAENLKESGTRR